MLPELLKPGMSTKDQSHSWWIVLCTGIYIKINTGKKFNTYIVSRASPKDTGTCISQKRKSIFAP